MIGCGQVSASSQSLRFNLSLREKGFITSRPGSSRGAHPHCWFSHVADQMPAFSRFEPFSFEPNLNIKTTKSCKLHPVSKSSLDSRYIVCRIKKHEHCKENFV